MRRFALLFVLLCLLCGGMMKVAYANEISVTRDDNGKDMLVDVSLRDAPIADVLTAMFNTTNGKYTMQLVGNVTGTIGRLQLSQTPFEDALNAILGNDYSYSKEEGQSPGTYLIKISGKGKSDTTAGLDTSAPTPVTSTPSTASLGIRLPDAQTIDSASSNEIVTGEIVVNYLDLASLCSVLGYQTISVFQIGGMATGGGGAGGASAFGGGGGGFSGGSSGASVSSMPSSAPGNFGH